jgi:hypothetical protein
MGNVESVGKKAISEAVRDGTIVDVSELGKKAGMRYPTFMSSGLAAKYDSQCPGGGVFANVSFFAFVLDDCDYEIYGPVFSGDHVCILEPNEEFGHVVLILEAGKAEKLGLTRTTDDRCEFVM